MITATTPDDSNEDSFMKSMLSMVAFGVGEMLGGLLIGQVVDRVGQKAAILTNVFLIALQTGVTLIFLYIFEYNWLAFAMTFMWGL
jgi:predicted MFS family arabinose efflux permease